MNRSRTPRRSLINSLHATVLLFGILITMVGCTSETPTSVPTATLTSTPTPAPTATLASTPTPAPTATLTSTPTPAPTATLASTPTPAPTATLASTPTPTPEPTIDPTIGCDDVWLMDDILGLSEENESTFSRRILKLYSDKIEEVERTTRVLRCKAEARMSTGGDSYITYYYEVDRDGDGFIGYSIGDPVPPPGAILSEAFPIGGVMKGADGAEIRVLEITADAWSLINNRFNDPPEQDNRFFMVRVEITIPSDALQSVAVDYFDFDLIGDSRVVYTRDDNCGVIPDHLDRELFPGGSTEGNVCFEIPQTERGLILIYNAGYSDEDRRFLQITE